MHDHQRNTQPDRQPDRDGNQLQRRLESAQVRQRRARSLVRHIVQQPTTSEARRYLEEDACNHDDKRVPVKKASIDVGQKPDRKGTNRGADIALIRKLDTHEMVRHPSDRRDRDQ